MSSRWSLSGEKGKLKKGPWTFEEDIRLLRYIKIHGDGRWSTLAKAAGLHRCGKSCRLRWVNYLRPGIKRGNISPEEERIIIDLHNRWGNRWSLIAERIPGRTDNEIKNYWRSHLKKKLQNSTHEINHIDDENRSPEAQVQDRQEIPQEKGLEVLTANEIRGPLLFENDGSVKVETPMNILCIEEVIKEMEQVQAEGEGKASFVQAGSIQNDICMAGQDAIDLCRTLYSFSSGIPIESYASTIYEASCSSNPELLYPTVTEECECELESGSDIMLWNMEPDTPIHLNGQTTHPSI